MNTFTTKDGTSIYYKDWGTGPVVTFSHGWPLSADAWDAQMLFLGQHGYRVIAHDRRGHGRSGQTWQGNNMDQYADDLSEGVREAFWLQRMQSSIDGSYDCIKAFSETDQTEDQNGTLKVIAGAPHGLCTTHADVINQELLAFLHKQQIAA
jgi:pimeloyl-ACP methyl ester carboxylesterase